MLPYVLPLVIVLFCCGMAYTVYVLNTNIMQRRRREREEAYVKK